MKVCILTPDYPVPGRRFGGVGVYSRQLAECLAGRGAEVHVAVYGYDPPPAPPGEPVRWHAVKLRVPLMARWLPGLSEAWQLRRWFERIDADQRFDIVEGYNDEGMCALAAGAAGERFRMRLHSSLKQHIEAKGQPWTWSRRFAVWLDRRSVRRSGRIATHSRLHAAEMAREYGIGEERITVFPHATPEPPAAPSVNGRRTVGFIGSLDRRKGIDVFLEACPRILEACPEARAVVIGGGDRRWQESFERERPGLASRVQFAGAVGDGELERRWSELAAVAVPSRYESFGLVAIEAFARGIPVIASRAGALPEVAGEGALMTAPGNAGELAAAAIRLLTDRGLAAEIGGRGRALYEQRYRMETFCGAVWRFYTEHSGN